MNYDDEKLKWEEEAMAAKLNAIGDWYKQADFEEMKNVVNGYATHLLQIGTKENPDEAEKQAFQEGYALIKQVAIGLTLNLEILEEKLERMSSMYYQHIKALAADGDAKAIAIYKELKPHYLDFMKSKLEKAAN
ncbi:hypothetical protein [Parasediminibacterium sp. JCM 36343]|uniref:hypothetical protein n=1 Tax=Parasediminibacterium sp. JCM 36343 TaxID=3374279 RepID=UPI00397A16D4